MKLRNQLKVTREAQAQWALVEAFSMIVKLQTSRRFVWSSNLQHGARAEVLQLGHGLLPDLLELGRAGGLPLDPCNKLGRVLSVARRTTTTWHAGDNTNTGPLSSPPYLTIIDTECLCACVCTFSSTCLLWLLTLTDLHLDRYIYSLRCLYCLSTFNKQMSDSNHYDIFCIASCRVLMDDGWDGRARLWLTRSISAFHTSL